MAVAINRWNLRDDLKKQHGTSSMSLQALQISYCSHVWIQIGVTVRKRPNWGKICFDLCDLWPWTLAWTSLLSLVIVKFLAHGQAHMGQMGKWPWQCTTTGLDNSTELLTEKIHQAVTEIWVLQVWQLPARLPGPWRQYPSSLEGWGVKRCNRQTDRQMDGRTDGQKCS